MDTNVGLKQAREDLKRDILENQDNIPVTRIFLIVDRILRKITRRKKPHPWYIGAITIALIVPMPTIVLSFALKETEQWDALGFIWIGYLEYAVASLILAQNALKYLIHNLQEFVMNRIDNKKDLERFGRVLSYIWEIPKYKEVTIIFTIYWCVSFSLVNSIYLEKFIGFGLTIGTMVFGLLVSSIIYTIIWAVYLNLQLGLYSYILNDVAPHQSELVFHLSRIFKSILYILTIWFALSTIMVSYNNLAKFSQYGCQQSFFLLGIKIQFKK